MEQGAAVPANGKTCAVTQMLSNQPNNDVTLPDETKVLSFSYCPGWKGWWRSHPRLMCCLISFFICIRRTMRRPQSTNSLPTSPLALQDPLSPSAFVQEWGGGGCREAAAACIRSCM